MSELLLWWVAVELLGIAALPLAAVALRHLPDRGWTLAKPLGLLALGWLVWLPLALFPALPYSRAWIFGTFAVFVAGNAALFLVRDIRTRLLRLFVRQRAYLFLGDLVFAGAFTLMGWLRSFNPAVVDQEKFMDVAFLSSIWRTPHLPPPDPWLAGQTINYYYFGHFLLATLAKALGTPPSVAFNVGVALVFALAAVAIFGVAANLLALLRTRGTGEARPGAGAPGGLLAAALVLVLGNPSAAAYWWQEASAYAARLPNVLANPWAWWLHRDLWASVDPYWFWKPSRLIPNTITEFPAFSFLLADLHAHVLSLPFTALAVGLGLSFALGQGEGLRAFGSRITGPIAAVGAAVILGALYAINGWDLPTYLGLALLALAIQQWLAHGRRLDSVLLLDLFALGATLVALCVLLYLPFYRGFSSPSQGVGLVPAAARSPIGLEFGFFGLAAFIAGSYLVWRLAGWAGAALAERLGDLPAAEAPGGGDLLAQVLARPRTLGWLLVGGFVALLLLLTLATPGFGGWTLIWALLFIGACAALAWRNLSPYPLPHGGRGRAAKDISEGEMVDLARGAISENADAGGEGSPQSAQADFAAASQSGATSVAGSTAGPFPAGADLSAGVGFRAEVWLLCLIGTAAALVAAAELVYLRDVFGGGDAFRMNTVFKLYYQAWLLLGVACGPALVVLARAASAYVASLFVPAARRPPARRRAIAAEDVRQTAASAARATGRAEAGPAPDARAEQPGHAIQATSSPVGIANGEHSAHDAALSKRASHRVEALRFARAGGILLWTALLATLFGASLIYPVLGSAGRTANFTLPRGMDGAAYMAADPQVTAGDCTQAFGGSNAGDDQAIAWLNAHVDGSPVIVEAPGAEYSHCSRISAFTGLPTLLGWEGHEVQWRVNWLAQPGRGDILGRRDDAIKQIYTNPDAGTVMRLLRQYSVRLIYVGAAERQLYPAANLDRFASFLEVKYQHAGVTIYAVPEGGGR